ncbi:MAG: c-type cytochrome, partial [Phycisphaerales bacterium]|nr:c-type cytochrome [Phycisphaerales bacterium]
DPDPARTADPSPLHTLHDAPAQTGSPAALAIAAGTVAAGVALWLASAFAGVAISRWWAPQPVLAIHPRLAANPPLATLDHDAANKGYALFERTCAACHDSSGAGKPNLGKDLIRSDFVERSSDAALIAFIARGRAATDPVNTTKVAMPPKGGNDALTDADLANVAVYLRGIQDGRRLPVLDPLPPAAPPAPPSQADKAAALAAAGGDADLAEIIGGGTRLYAATCAACHGPAGKGIKGLGKDLAESPFVHDTKDDDLLAFIKRGRGPTDQGNTTGVAMPPKGGNPAMSDDDILDVIAYLRTLQPKAGAAAAPQK